MVINTGSQGSGYSMHCRVPARFIERETGLQQQFKVAQISVTETMVVTKSLRQCGLYSHGDLCLERRIMQMLQATQASETKT